MRFRCVIAIVFLPPLDATQRRALRDLHIMLPFRATQPLLHADATALFAAHAPFAPAPRDAIFAAIITMPLRQLPADADIAMR